VTFPANAFAAIRTPIAAQNGGIFDLLITDGCCSEPPPP
jgi:hypothetical protein